MSEFQKSQEQEQEQEQQSSQSSSENSAEKPVEKTDSPFAGSEDASKFESPVADLLAHLQQPKQDYSEAHKQFFGDEPKDTDTGTRSKDSGAGPSGTGGSGSSSASGGSKEEENLLSRNKKAARKIVITLDRFASHFFMRFAKENDAEAFRASSTEINDMATDLAEGLSEAGKEIKFPWWLGLTMTAGLTYFGAYEKAAKLRKINLAKETAAAKKAAAEARNTSSSSSGTQNVEYFDANGNPTTKEAVESADYWKGSNPVSDIKNHERISKGGKLCTICNVNHCEPDKEVCSQACSGKRTQQMKGK